MYLPLYSDTGAQPCCWPLTGSWTGSNLSAEWAAFPEAGWRSPCGGHVSRRLFWPLCSASLPPGALPQGLGERGLSAWPLCFLLLAVAIPYVPDAHPEERGAPRALCVLRSHSFCGGPGLLSALCQRSGTGCGLSGPGFSFWMVLGILASHAVPGGFYHNSSGSISCFFHRRVSAVCGAPLSLPLTSRPMVHFWP